MELINRMKINKFHQESTEWEDIRMIFRETDYNVCQKGEDLFVIVGMDTYCLQEVDWE